MVKRWISSCHSRWILYSYRYQRLFTTNHDFKQSLWQEIDTVKTYFNIIDSTDLKESLVKVYNPENNNKNLELNTVDVLFTRDHTYQLIYGLIDEENNQENYIGSVINYKRKPIKGTCVLVKIKLSENSVSKKLEYKEAPMSMEDVEFIIKDLYYHRGFIINSKMQEFYYNNKSVIERDNIVDLNKLYSQEVNLFGIPFKIWYKENSNSSISTGVLSYVRDVGYFLNKKVSEIYITCSIYPQCKCLSLDEKLVKQFIELITTFPDEGELKEITIAYNFSMNKSKEKSSENVFVIFNDFYWKVMKENSNM